MYRKTGIDVMEWARKGCDLGAGEIFLTSVDRDGTMKGMDIELIQKLTQSLPIPVIASGGLGSVEDCKEVLYLKEIDAIAIGSALHYGHLLLDEIRDCVY